MKKNLLTLAIAMTALASPAMASDESSLDKFGYNSTELSASQVELDGIDLGMAITVKGSQVINDQFYLAGGYHTLNVDEGEIQAHTESSSTSEMNTLFGSVGYRLTPNSRGGKPNEDISIFGELGLSRTSIDIDALHQNDSSIFVTAGIRAELNDYLAMKTQISVSEYKDLGTSTSFSGSFDYFLSEKLSIGLNYRFFTLNTPEVLADREGAEDMVSGSELGINARFHF